MSKTKKELRLDMKKRLQSFSENEVTKFSKQIADTLYSTESWKNSHLIGITISRGNEIETREIIERAWQEGKEVAVPKCLPEEKKMVFKRITTFNQLETVYFGLLEPIVSKTKSVDPQKIDLLIVPGVCFTEKGYRIGYGGGYFDRYLEGYQEQTISLLFECQLLPKLPIESFDVPVQIIITEKRIIDCLE
ncbi:5-formyltetrahydrofolate cyclo-ligase [Bacillus sp. DJP31]|uniref:5-formyltetrahydrofolate cyclo-ligase n=1 Tax=Bacillus sp. DJP31 TaxID=3409789 RepID=UPI003BB604C8